MEAMALGAQLEAMITDPVYEGKSLAGLIDLVRVATSRRTRTCCTPTSAGSRRSTRTTALAVPTSARAQLVTTCAVPIGAAGPISAASRFASSMSVATMSASGTVLMTWPLTKI